jgi:hypothetical protein
MTARLGSEPGSRISIYSAERARFELANGLSRRRCPPLCTPVLFRQTRRALSQRSSLQGPIPLCGELAWACLVRSLLLERNVQIRTRARRLPLHDAAIAASCRPMTLSADRQFPYDVFALAFEASASD